LGDEYHDEESSLASIPGPLSSGIDSDIIGMLVPGCERMGLTGGLSQWSDTDVREETGEGGASIDSDVLLDDGVVGVLLLSRSNMSLTSLPVSRIIVRTLIFIVPADSQFPSTVIRGRSTSIEYISLTEKIRRWRQQLTYSGFQLSILQIG
jgi:hypothetical protein